MSQAVDLSTQPADDVARAGQPHDIGGFVAGTLVHTEDGLKPIEQIKVGDMVLSRHESGVGELCYQPVTRTFEYEDRAIYYVNWQVLDKETLTPNVSFLDIDRNTLDHKQIFGEMAVTGAHPIWVKRVVESRMDAEGDDFVDIAHEINRWMSIEEIYLWNWKAYWDFEWNRGLGGGQLFISSCLMDSRLGSGTFNPSCKATTPMSGWGLLIKMHGYESHIRGDAGLISGARKGFPATDCPRRNTAP